MYKSEIPYHAWGASYYDELGNISTSSVYKDVLKLLKIIFFFLLKKNK